MLLLAHSLSEGRWRLAPEVARFNEQGVDFVGSAWNAFVAPAGTPAALRTQLAMAMTAALHLPATVTRLRNLGLEPTGGTPAELRARIQADRQHWAPIIAASSFKADDA